MTDVKDFNEEGMFYLLYAVQLKKIIVSTDIEKTVQEHNDPDLEFELLGRTNDPEMAKEKAMEYYSKVQLHGSPHSDGLGNHSELTDFKLS